MKSRIFVIVCTVLLWSCAGVMDKESRAVFLDRTKPLSVTVYPVHVVISDKTHSDTDLQKQLVDHLNVLGYAEAIASEDDVEIPFIWGANQAKMFRRSAENFAAQLAGKPLSTSYALLVETLSIQVEDNMGGVHYYIVDNQGHVVDGALSNTHWNAFTSVSPKNRQEGLQVAFNILKNLELK